MSTKCRVLILDDNKDAADTLAEVLTLEGHVVRVCYAAVDALQIAAIFKPEVCILDISLPQFDGNETAKALRALYGRGQILIALSGLAAPEDIARGRMAGFDHYVAKPAKLDELFAMLVKERNELP
jgi:DNA-binding response OmpR family regulator